MSQTGNSQRWILSSLENMNYERSLAKKQEKDNLHVPVLYHFCHQSPSRTCEHFFKLLLYWLTSETYNEWMEWEKDSVCLKSFCNNIPKYHLVFIAESNIYTGYTFLSWESHKWSYVGRKKRVKKWKQINQEKDVKRFANKWKEADASIGKWKWNEEQREFPPWLKYCVVKLLITVVQSPTAMVSVRLLLWHFRLMLLSRCV